MEHNFVEKIVNVQTGEETIRQYTLEEVEKTLDELAESAALVAKQTQAAAAKAALLEKLGITEEEAKLLLS